MAQIDLTFFWAGIGLYGFAVFVFFYGLIATGGKGLKVAVFIVGGGLFLHTISLGLRWYFSGHMPGDNIYELNSVGGWFTVLFFLVLQYYYPRTRVIGIFALAITLAMMLYGYAKPHGMGPLSDEYQSHWFYFHIISAFLAYSCYVIASSAAVLFLARQYDLWRFADAEKIPSQDFLEDLNVRFVMYGFGGHAVMLASGSIWANTAWGSYWNWDPVETWSLITWLIYGFQLHAKTFLGWRGDRLAWTTIVALVAIIFTFWGVPHLPTKDLTH